MLEDAIKNVEINDLFDLLMKTTKELIELTHTEQTEAYDAKKTEVQLLQRIIVEKRAEFRPGFSL